MADFAVLLSPLSCSIAFGNRDNRTAIELFLAGIADSEFSGTQLAMKFSTQVKTAPNTPAASDGK
ncbi:MAG TPA: hypothetical protein VGM05_19955 [Planctomycetaceae bacterium]|jgi:hypothetical protein